MNEKELRRKIRSDLEQQHQKKLQEQAENGRKESSGSEQRRKEAKQKFIRRVLRERHYSSYPQFIKCSNHLNEFEWLTEAEIARQHEFYPVNETLWQRIRNSMKGDPLRKIPKEDWIPAYIDEQSALIEANIKSRLETLERLSREVEQNSEKQRETEIISAEQEDFYRQHPDYHQYRNYLGETRWLTDEEFENQDEYFEEVPTTGGRIRQAAVWISIAIIVIFAAVWLNTNFGSQSDNGYVIIESNEQRGQLYVNEQPLVGFSPGVALNFNKGEYKISLLRSGMVSSPRFHLVNITPGDTARIKFDLHPQKTGNKAMVRINSPQPDAKIFINNEFFGMVKNNRQVILDPGEHEIMIKKDNFQTEPAMSRIALKKGDTLDLTFRMFPRSGSAGRNASAATGLLEVSSNIRGARILIDGTDSGFRTDYILSKVSFGRHIVSVQKDGYRTYPREREILINSRNKSKKVDFKLSKATVPAFISTQPVNGRIYIDGKDMGIGQWRGSLSIGEHRVHFGPVYFYKTPQPKTIFVSENESTEEIFYYIPDFKLSFSPNGIIPADNVGGIQLGYLVDNKSFFIDPGNGPETIVVPELGQRVWKLGSAFSYRNPPEGDAVTVTFTIPAGISHAGIRTLKLWGYRSGEIYPQAPKEVSKIRIEVNGQSVSNNYLPKYEIREAGGAVFESFPVRNLLKAGKNSIMIGTDSENTEYFLLWKVAIE